MASRPLRPDEVQQHLEDYLAEGDSLNILVAGKMGVGKSSLINSIYGADLSKEGTSAASVTNEIVNFIANIPTPHMQKGPGERGREGMEKVKDSTIRIWDSVGFGDIFAENKEKTVQELVWVVDKVHVLLYCFDIRQRLSGDDAMGIIEITRKTHPDIWRNAVFVLTFCNALQPPPGSEVDPVQFFFDAFVSWRTQIIKTLKQKAGVPDEIVKGISIVAAGYRNIQPPGYRNWYTTFWSTIFEKTRDDGQPVLLKMTSGRMVNNHPDVMPDISELEVQDSALGTSPYALKVDLFGEKEQPGVVTANFVPRLPCTPLKPQPMVPARYLPSEPPVAGHIANGRPVSSGASGHIANGQPASIETQPHIPAHLVASVGPSAPTGGDGIMVWGSPPPDSLKAPPPAASNDRPPQPAADPPPPAAEPPPQLLVEPQVRDQVGGQAGGDQVGGQAGGDQVGGQVGGDQAEDQVTRKTILMGAGGVAGATATGALVGALVGIAGGGIGIGVGAAGGALVGASVGVIGLIVRKLMKYIEKKRHAQAQAGQNPV